MGKNVHHYTSNLILHLKYILRLKRDTFYFVFQFYISDVVYFCYHKIIFSAKTNHQRNTWYLWSWIFFKNNFVICFLLYLIIT